MDSRFVYKAETTKSASNVKIAKNAKLARITRMPTNPKLQRKLKWPKMAKNSQLRKKTRG